MASPTEAQAIVIRDAVSNIALLAPTDARHVIEEYVRVLVPGFAKGGDSYLPSAVRRHPRNPERCGVETSKHSLLCFHIGNAVLAYYASVNEGKMLPELERRAEFLHRIAKAGMNSFVIGGDIVEGFYLSNPQVDEQMEKRYGPKQVPPPKVQKAEGKADAGGGGNQANPKGLQ